MKLTSEVPGFHKEAEVFVDLVGKRVRAERQEKALARRELSERSGVSMRYLAQLESGKGNISVSLLYRIAKALECGVESFICDDANYHSNNGSTANSETAPEPGQISELYRNAPIDVQQRVKTMLTSASSVSRRAHRIALIGLRGAGKSTLGPRLGKALAVPFVELNNDIELKAGIAVNEIIALYGFDGYRQLEQQAIERIVQSQDSVVVAVAGGIVSQPDTFDYLLHNFSCVWLRATPEEHMQRVRSQGDERPMTGDPEAMQKLEAILKSREVLYAKAEMELDTRGRSLDESEADLVAAIKASATAT